MADDPATSADETGGLAGARAIAFGPDGDLYVAAGSIDKVLRYDGRTGRFKSVAAEGGGLRGPVGLSIATDGTLFVGGALDNALHVFRDGAFVRRCATPTLHASITGVLAAPDGFVFATTAARNCVLRVNPSTCEMSVFASSVGIATGIYMNFAPDGHLLVGSFVGDSVIKLHRETGASLGAFIAAGSGGLDGTHAIAVVPQATSFTAKLVVPGVARAAGGAGSFFRTSMWITNPAASPISLRLRFVPGAGFTGIANPTSQPIAIPPDRMVSFGDVLTEAFGATIDTGGVVLVETADGSPLPFVTARTFNDTPGGTFGQYIEALPLVRGDAEVWLDGLAGDAKSRTNVGIVNVTASPIAATMRLFDTAGFEIGMPFTVAVPANSSYQITGIVAGGMPYSAQISGVAGTF
ncbi:MAG TPA: hypothetical protein VF698_00070, partial [Thermoanaerobaculia bacterium]